MKRFLGVLLLAILALVFGSIFLFGGLTMPSHPSRSAWLVLGIINIGVSVLLSWRFYFRIHLKRGR